MKAIVFAVLTFIAAAYLGAGMATALAIAAVPLFLGATNVLASLGYLVAVCLILSAAVWFILPNDAKATVQQQIEHIVDNIKEAE